MQRIAILDYSAGNLHSVVKKIIFLGAQPIVCKAGLALPWCDKLILPGVGHFATAARQLWSTAMYDSLQHLAFVKKKPVLGICLGLQLMARASEEAPGYRGLSWLKTEVVRFQQQDKRQFRTPHTGWNTVEVKGFNLLFNHMPSNAEFFFTHAFHLQNSQAVFTSAETHYGYSFTAAVQQENLFGVQFHPEKSHKAGGLLIKNFLNI